MTDIFDPKDSTDFRRVLGHFASGITIVTSELNGKRVGFTCQSFASVSLDPPLVVFFARRDLGSWAAIQDAGIFCVNVLAENQENLARIFATSGVDKYHDALTKPSPNGSPILDGVIAWIDCTVEDVFRSGDHDAVIGRVNAMAHVGNESPLLYFRGGYGTFAS